jgi:hypothetical protein
VEDIIIPNCSKNRFFGTTFEYIHAVHKCPATMNQAHWKNLENGCLVGKSPFARGSGKENRKSEPEVITPEV